MIGGTPSNVAGLANLFNDIYEDTLFVAKATNIMAGLVTPMTGEGVATRYIPIFNELTASSVSEGGTPSTQQMTKGTADTIVPQYIRTKVGLTDQRMMTDPDEGRSYVAREAGAAIAKKVDQDLLAEFANFSQDFGAAGSALTLRRCANAVSYLQAQNAMDTVHLVVHPYQWNRIFLELTQIGITTRAANAADVVNQAMRAMVVDSMNGAMWHMDNNLGTGTAVVSGAFVREAIALDTRLPLSQEEVRDANIQGWYIFHNMWYGTGTPRPTFGCKLTADASLPTAT